MRGMPAGRPTDLSAIVDFPEIKREKAGNLHIQRKPKAGRESDWCLELLNGYDRWCDIVDMKPAQKIEVEKPLAPEGKHILGLCRADAIVWHSEKEVSIIETKVDCSPVSIATGIGQLLYYKTLVQVYWGVKVEALLLAAPQLPPLLLESIADVNAPIRFLKRDAEDNLSGLVPRYCGA